MGLGTVNKRASGNAAHYRAPRAIFGNFGGPLTPRADARASHFETEVMLNRFRYSGLSAREARDPDYNLGPCVLALVILLLR